ncbi:pirin family protein [Flexithrix dorotheae]|uniref:pirin family protein n=1 Tax=Flexithrix dorotheae TaxID=70993 RepID=UPI000366CA06|nr:pirin family protein [Flexithrix dorotheae]
MKTRSISRVDKAQKVNMDGFIVDQALPLPQINMVNPFLLIHHADAKYEAGANPKTTGVGPHPHRGFIPVTFVYKGEVHHRDSRGNSSVVKAGGTQWMHSGMGVIHSERPSKAFAAEGGKMEIIQLWINVPAAHKMVQPRYFPLEAEETPEINSPDNLVNVQVVTGEFGGVKGPIPQFTPMVNLRITAQKSGKIELPIDQNFNTLLYLLDGKLKINGSHLAGRKELVVFDNDGESIQLEAEENTRAILLAGVPIEEKVVSHGPFVMNKDTEIMEAMRDYQMGKMGVLIEDF